MRRSINRFRSFGKSITYHYDIAEKDFNTGLLTVDSLRFTIKFIRKRVNEMRVMMSRIEDEDIERDVLEPDMVRAEEQLTILEDAYAEWNN
jgi:DTW domain-containing protein YfiP